MSDVEAYTYDGTVYCEDCLPVPEDDEEVGVIFDTDEWGEPDHDWTSGDYVEVCGTCGVELRRVTGRDMFGPDHMSSVEETLQAARELIADPRSWSRLTAESCDGELVAPADPRACRWSAIGAVCAVTYRQGLGDWLAEQAIDALHSSARRRNWPSLHHVNYAGHYFVMRTYDDAIAHVQRS